MRSDEQGLCWQACRAGVVFPDLQGVLGKLELPRDAP